MTKRKPLQAATEVPASYDVLGLESVFAGALSPHETTPPRRIALTSEELLKAVAKAQPN